MTEPPWTYRAVMHRVVDGDTVDMTIDLGFGSWIMQRLRLADVDTPEMRGPERAEGITAKSVAEVWLERATALARQEGARWPLLVTTAKADKYGRYIATVCDVEGNSLNQHLRDSGWGSST